MQRLQEVLFGDAGSRVRSLLMTGDIKGARAQLAQMEAAAADHPWLRHKVAHLKELVENDAVMASKELRYSSGKMSSRLATLKDVVYSVNETDSSAMPAFLRRKSSEGTGRRK